MIAFAWPFCTMGGAIIYDIELDSAIALYVAYVA